MLNHNFNTSFLYEIRRFAIITYFLNINSNMTKKSDEELSCDMTLNSKKNGYWTGTCTLYTIAVSANKNKIQGKFIKHLLMNLHDVYLNLY